MPNLQDILSMIQTGRASEAEPILEAAYEMSPDNPALAHLLGLVKLQLHQNEAAILLLEQALVSPKPQASVWIALATALLNTSQVSKADAAFQEALRLDPGNVTTLLNLARTRLAQNNLESAQSLYEQGRDLAPEMLDISYELAEVYANQGNLAAAAQTLAAITDHQPDIVTPGIKAGFLYFKLGDIQTAEKQFLSALSTDPTQQQALFGLGALNLQKEDWPKAIAYLQSSLALAPTHTASIEALALCLMKQNHWAEALTYLVPLSEKHPHTATHLRDRGWCEVQIKHYDQGLENLEQAFLMAPHDPITQYYLAMGLYEYGEIDQGLELLNTCPMGTASAAQLVNASAVYRDTGHLDKALKQLDQAQAKRPDNPNIYNHFGVTYHMKGDIEAALKNFQKAIDLVPSNAMPHVNKGYSLLIQGDLEAGYAELSHRWASFSKNDGLPGQQWLGQDIGDAPLLLYADNNTAEFVLMARFFEHVQRKAYNIYVLIPQTMVRLVRYNWPKLKIITDPSQIGVVSYKASIIDLPALCRITDLQQLAATVPYTSVYEDLSSNWLHRLPKRTTGQPRVGLFLGPDQAPPKESLRYLTSDIAAAYLSNLDVEWICLGVANKTKADWVTPLPHTADLFDLAAIIEHLDLVISVDHALLHIAGSMGIPAWGLISAAPSYYWHLNRTDSPWYPSVKLYRQMALKDWSAPFEEIRTDLLSLTTGI